MQKCKNKSYRTLIEPEPLDTERTVQTWEGDIADVCVKNFLKEIEMRFSEIYTLSSGIHYGTFRLLDMSLSLCVMVQ